MRATHPDAPLKYVCDLNADTLPETTSPDWKFEYIDIGNVDRHRGVTATEWMRFADAPSRARRRVRVDDVIISTVRTYLRAATRIAGAHDGAVASTGFAVLSPLRSAVEPRFLGYAVTSPVFVDGVVSRSVGVSYPAINPSALARMAIPAPSLPAQCAIADFLDRECERIEAIRSQVDTWKRLLRAQVVARRSELLTGHKTLALGNAVTILDHRRIPLNREARASRPGPIPYWGANDIQDHIDDYLFDEALVLISEDGGPFFDVQRDAAWCVAGPCWVNNHAHVLRPRRGWAQAFIAHALNATDFAAYITGATRDKLTQEELRRIRIPALGADEQYAIVDEMRALERAGRRAADVGSRLVGRLTEYRDALITEAVTGQLDITRLSDSRLDESAHAAAEGEAPEVLAG